MRYEKTIWVKDVTIISAKLLNKIENELEYLNNTTTEIESSVLKEAQSRVESDALLDEKLEAEITSRKSYGTETDLKLESLNSRCDSLASSIEAESSGRILALTKVDGKIENLATEIAEVSLISRDVEDNSNLIADIQNTIKKVYLKDESYLELTTTDKTLIGAINELQQFSASQSEVDTIQERITQIFDILSNFPVPLT